MALSIAYMTNRRGCRAHWFFDSLKRQAGDAYASIRVIVVDFFADERGDEFAQYRTENVIWTTPKPTPWAGKYRLTGTNYFAPSNARNTALCYAPDGHIAFVDDLSVLMPNWLHCVWQATAGSDIILGRYAKVRNLTVEDGIATGYTEFPEGVDSRFRHSLGRNVLKVTGGWMYGCSLVAPVEAFLKINGWNENCDSIGSEDSIAGLMLERQGYSFYYNQGMLTLESEELHHVERPFVRIIKPRIEGVSNFPEKDSSWALLRMVDHGDGRAANYCDLRELRQRILAGEAFPTGVNPQHDWSDSQPLAEMNGETSEEYVVRHRR